MSMIDVFESLGRRDAIELRNEASELDGTQIIARENSIPYFIPSKDYTDWPVGSPVAFDDQVWLLIQPHNAANYDGNPSTLRSLWGLAHTKDPSRAKSWVEAYGTSGMYMTGECYKDYDGHVYRALEDNLVYSHDARPDAWELVL